jgi:hypothetical protein
MATSGAQLNLERARLAKVDHLEARAVLSEVSP